MKTHADQYYCVLFLYASRANGGQTIDINRSGPRARMFFALKLALSVENSEG